MADVQGAMSNVQYSLFIIPRVKSNIQRSLFIVQCAVLTFNVF